MESKTIPVFSPSSHSRFTGHIQSGTVSAERVAAEAWNSCVLYNSTAAPNVSHSERPGAALETAAESQARFSEGGISMPLCCGAGLFSRDALEHGSLYASLSASRVCKEENFICSVFNKADWKSDAGCHNSQAWNVKMDRLEANLSKTCQKKFIMFDHSGSTQRIIFHPDMVHEVPTLPYNPYVDPLKHASGQAVDHLKETILPCPTADFAAWEARLPAYRKEVPSSSGMLLTKMCGDPQPLAFRGENDSLQPSKAASEAKMNSCNEVSLNFSGGTHEDTEDIEALLSSDDDDDMSSTGHSPSDMTCNNSPCLSNDDSYDSWDNSPSNAAKKRKREVVDCCNDDENSSTATSANVLPKDLNCHCPVVSRIGNFESAVLREPGESGYWELGFTPFDMNIPDEVSSKGSVNKQRQYPRSLSERRPAKRSRKEKIKSTFQLLRGIIPGGDYMDTAFVLDEAIHYVKSLQVKVQKLEAKKLVE